MDIYEYLITFAKEYQWKLFLDVIVKIYVQIYNCNNLIVKN